VTAFYNCDNKVVQQRVIHLFIM